MNLTPTTYTASDESWNYHISLIKDNSWSVIRWPAGEVRIPPRAFILTVNGWENLLNTPPSTLYLTDREVGEISTGAFVLP